MIQNPVTTNSITLYYANLDLYTNTVLYETNSLNYKPLFKFESLQTNKIKYVLPFFAIATNERYVRCTFFNYVGSGTSTVSEFGADKNYPFGFYKTTVYKNTSDTNIDPSGLTELYKTLMNVYPATASHSPTTYSEYTTNDTETDNIYITI